MPAAASQILTMAQMISYARAAGWTGNDAIIAGAVGMAESSGNTHAINYIPCVGVWQVNVKAHPQYTIEAMYDPAQNAKAAYAIWQSQGWAAWSTYTSGAYKKYLPAAQNAAGASGGNATGATAGIGALNPINVGTQLGSAYKNINGVLSAIQQPGFWKRLLLIIVGVILIFIGLIKMSATPKNIRIAEKIAEVAAV